MTINPKQITNTNRTKSELEAFWIFCIVVAGKNSDWASRTVAKFLSKRGELSPFAFIRSLGDNALHNTLVANRVGQYGRIHRAITQSLSLDLQTATVDDLTSVFGVGSKTARFFLVHSREDVEHAVLDTHILKWLSRRIENVPKSTPPEKTYLKLEKKFISLAKAEFPNMTIAQIDLLIWMQESGRLDQDNISPKLP